MPYERPALSAPDQPERRALPGRVHERQRALPDREKRLQLPPHTPEQNKKKLVIVDVADQIEEEALDTAEARLTAAKEERKGIKGFFTKIWKDNLFREYYRQKEKTEAKKTIIENKNIHAGETSDLLAHRQSMGAVVDRFSLDYADAVHREAGEVSEVLDRQKPDDQTIRSELHSLIRRYAAGEINDAQFEEAKIAAFGRLPGAKRSLVEKGMQYADNLLEIAKNVKQNVEHGAGMEALDFDFEVVVGKAKNGVRTKSQANKVDKIVEKITENKVGRFVNEATVASVVAIASSVGSFFAQRVVRSKLLAWGTFGATALLGGGLAGARESARLEQERRQHSREMAKGKAYEADKSPRRKEMEEGRYETRSASEMTSGLRDRLMVETEDGQHLEKAELSQDEFNESMARLMDIEARISLSDKRGVDLLGYTDALSIEQERLSLDIARAEAKVQLRKFVEQHPERLSPELRGKTFDEILGEGRDILANGLVTGEQGMEKKDARFKAMKRKKVAGAVLKGIVTGLVVGGVFQEVGALVRSGQDGFFEGVFGHTKAGNAVTALEHLRRILGGEQPKIPHGGWQELMVGSTHLRVPSGVGVDLANDGKGMYWFLKDGQPISDHFTLNPDGTLTKEATRALQGAGIQTTQEVHAFTEMRPGVQKTEDFIKTHPGSQSIHRVRWYDNDTPKPIIDQNEKLLTGGHRLDSHGNIVYSMKHMTEDGSHTGKHSINPKELMKQGKLKLLFSLSRDSQRTVYEVPFDAHGNAVIHPNTDVARALFTVDPSGKVHFDGKFAEVAHTISIKNGVENIGVMATDVGPGMDFVGNVLVPTPVDQSVLTFHLPADYLVDIPAVIPFGTRTPLEPTGRPNPERANVDPHAPPSPRPALPGRPESRRLPGEVRILRSDRALAVPAVIGAARQLRGPERKNHRIEGSPAIRGLLPGKGSEPSKEPPKSRMSMVEYIESLPPAYRDELGRHVDRVPALDLKRTKEILAIPLYDVDEDTARGMLEKAISGKKDLSKFEIIVLQGQRPKMDKAQTQTALSEFMKKHPRLRVIYVNRVMGQNAPKAKPEYLEKYMHDLMTIRLQRAGAKEGKDVPILNFYTEVDYRKEVPRVVVPDRTTSNPKTDANDVVDFDEVLRGLAPVTPSEVVSSSAPAVTKVPEVKILSAEPVSPHVPKARPKERKEAKRLEREKRRADRRVARKEGAQEEGEA